MHRRFLAGTASVLLAGCTVRDASPPQPAAVVSSEWPRAASDEAGVPRRLAGALDRSADDLRHGRVEDARAALARLKRRLDDRLARERATPARADPPTIRQTRTATAQVEALFELEYYSPRDRDGRARDLPRIMGEALDRIEADPMAGRPDPGPYPAVARWGYRWIGVRRDWWFGYVVAPDGPVLTDIIYDAAASSGRVQDTNEGVSIPPPKER